MKFFIVHAHAEPKSFNGALTRHAKEVLETAGHEVIISDLYAMEFDPVSDRRNFTNQKESDYFKQQVEEIYATEVDGFAPEIKAEMEKIDWCDVLIFQCPLWWFGLPAMLKGWVDRVFAMGRIYGRGKWYDNGVFKGKKALLSLTVGGGEAIYSETGLNGDINQILFPINHGIFRFVGFDVLPPFIVWSTSRISDERRQAYLQEYAQRLLNINETPTMTYPSLADYDENFQLKLSKE
ncbi:MAG: NAD(P)H-dependent oxidoreductase [Stigonema ocellatum SAG 48.90 = DSM 106950]|nr:NAD(P)H-dependent oxidoreductase [Stigonema ocellatum SAG 48.90 = DSM 106950]